MPLQHVVGLGLPGCPTGQKMSLLCSAVVLQNEDCMSVVVLCTVWVLLVCAAGGEIISFWETLDGLWRQQ